MREALVIFMILLILLTIISVFGGSVRITPGDPGWFKQQQLMAQQQQRQYQSEFGPSSSTATAGWGGSGAQWIAERFNDNENDDDENGADAGSTSAPVQQHPTGAPAAGDSDGALPPADPSAVSEGPVEPFMGSATELAPF